MSIKQTISVLGLSSLGIGLLLWIFSVWVEGFYFILFGLAMAVVQMFWGTSGKFQEVLDKHTGAYDHELRNSPKDKLHKQPQKRRQW